MAEKRGKSIRLAIVAANDLSEGILRAAASLQSSTIVLGRSSRECTEEQARLLSTAVGSPLLVISGVMYDSVGRPVEAGVAWLRGDFAEVEIEVVSQ